MKLASLILGAAAMLAGLVVSAQAGHHCGSCNCSNGHKVCRLVPEVTKVVTFKYGLECEDFCVNGRSKCVGTQPVCNCNGCCKCEKIMQPTCCEVRNRAKLVKYPVVTEKCGWKCVVVHVCNGCNRCQAAARPATDAELQMALHQAESQGILLTSAVEPIEVTIADDEVQQPAPPAELPKSLQAPRTIGSFFSK